MFKSRMKEAHSPKQVKAESESVREQKEAAIRETPNKNWPLLTKFNYINTHEKKLHRGLGANASYLHRLYWSPKLEMWLYYYPQKALQLIANLNRRFIRGVRRKPAHNAPKTALSAAGLKLCTGGSPSFAFLTQNSAQSQETLFIAKADKYQFITKFLEMNETKENIDKFRAIQDLSKISDGAVEEEAVAAYAHLIHSTSSPEPSERPATSSKRKRKKAIIEVDETMEESKEPERTASAPSHRRDAFSLPKPAMESTLAVLRSFSRTSHSKQDPSIKGSTERKSEANPGSQQEDKSVVYTREKRKRPKSSWSELNKLNEIITELSENVEALRTLYDEKASENWNHRLQKTKKLTNNLLNIIKIANIGEYVRRQCYSSLGLIHDALYSLPDNLPKDDKDSVKIQNAFEFCEGLQEIVNQAINPKRDFENVHFHSATARPLIIHGIPALDREVLRRISRGR